MPGEQDTNVNGDAKDTQDNDKQGKNTETITIDAIELKEIKDELARLKEFQSTVVAEKQTEKEKRQKTERDAAIAKAELENNFKELIRLKDEEIADRDRKWHERDKADQKRQLQDKALELATKLAPSDLRRAKILAKELENRLQLTADGLKVLDQNGNLTITQVDGLLDEFRKNYDFLVDGLDSGGSGTRGSGGNNKIVKNLKEMTEKEQVELYNTDRETWQRLKQSN